MFGYIQANNRELKIKDYELYRSYYCGLCHTLKKRYGRRGQLLLNYDMTFLALVLTGLYEPEEEKARRRCALHPAAAHEETINRISEYAADMTVLLAYQKALDDWRDEKSPVGRSIALFLYKDYAALRRTYPRQAKTLEKCVRDLAAAEKVGSSDIDQTAGLTGRFLGEMFAWRDDIWQEDLREMGFFLGKFIYLMDARDDLEKDLKKGTYNILLPLKEQDPEGFEKQVQSLLIDMMSGCCRAFERLPVVERAPIIRNILYSGVWNRYGQVVEKEKRKDGKAQAKAEKKAGVKKEES